MILYHSLLFIEDDTVWFLLLGDIEDFVSILSSKRIPLSNGGGCGNFIWISFDDWFRIVCNVGKSFDWLRGRSGKIEEFELFVVIVISRLFCFGNVLNVEEVFWNRSLKILFVGLINGGWKLTFFVCWRRVDFRVRVVSADIVVEDGFCCCCWWWWLCERSRSDVDDDVPLYGQERKDEENSPSVVDGLLPDGGWEF